MLPGAPDGPIRIAMVTPNFPPHRGGVESHTHEVSRRLAADRGFEVRVLTTDLAGRLPAQEVMDGISVERYPAHPRRWDLYWSPAIARRLAEMPVDLVHVQGYHTLLPVQAMMVARRRHVPYVVTFHSGGHSSRLRHRLRPMQIRLMRPLLRGARLLVAVSAFEADLFRRALKVGPDRLVVIPNGIDLPHEADAEPIEPDETLILSVGRLERYKGQDRLVRALPRVRRAIPEARLLLLGDGPQREQLQQLARREGVADAVEVRSVPRSAMYGELRRAAVVALLSEYESHGLGAYEALALGARIVASDSTALGELRDMPGVRTVDPAADDAEVADVLLAQLRAPRPADGERPPIPTWDECAAALAQHYRAVVAASRS